MKHPRVKSDQSIRVLLVKASDGDAERISTILKDDSQIALSRVRNIQEAIHALERGEFHLIMADYALADGNGFDFLRAMDKKGLEAPVVVMSNHEDEIIASQLIQVGAYDYITEDKVSEKSLSRIIANALEKAHLKSEIKEAQNKVAEMSTGSGLKRLFSRRYKLASTWLGYMLFRSSESLYVRLSRNVFFLILGVATVPCLIQGVIAHHQINKTVERQYEDQLVWRMRSTQKAVDQFLENHMVGLCSLLGSYGIKQFKDQEGLRHILSRLKQEFPNFVDLGLIDSSGLQQGYEGPYKLLRKDYHDEYWFHEVMVRGRYISDVFLGYRQIPHVALAIKSPSSHEGGAWILRATIDVDAFDEIVGAMNCGHEDDTLILNRKGFLQNTSRFHGNALSRLDMPILTSAQDVILTEGMDARNQKAIIAYAPLSQKDWVLAFVQPLFVKQEPVYALRHMLIAVLLMSFAGVFLLALWITRNFVGRLRRAEQEHDALLQGMEHTNKLASIGRLAAGVAHEINNPVAIINEKAGLMKDLTEMSDDFANKERFLDLLRSIHSSVVRCRTVTHRLLGFARQMHVAPEMIDLNDLLREVVSFLERDAFHREIKIDLDLREDLRPVKTDRGQVQQVFLNIINNAMDAVDDGGEIRIKTWGINEGMVGVEIADNGCGIPPDTLKRIFEPFFTTKDRGKGTGLGLSITYGIVAKLGGKISVESEVNKGTSFTIELPRDYEF